MVSRYLFIFAVFNDDDQDDNDDDHDNDDDDNDDFDDDGDDDGDNDGDNDDDPGGNCWQLRDNTGAAFAFRCRQNNHNNNDK